MFFYDTDGNRTAKENIYSDDLTDINSPHTSHNSTGIKTMTHLTLSPCVPFKTGNIKEYMTAFSLHRAEREHSDIETHKER